MSQGDVMTKPMIEQMVRAVDDGYTPSSVWEASMTYGVGSRVKVNKDTKAQLYPDGGSVDLPRDSVVTVLAPGAGESGKDLLVMLPDATKGVVPFYDLGEGVLRREQDGMMPDDERYVRVNMVKPIPQEASDWLKNGYQGIEGIELPTMPEDDQPDSVTFLMKAKDQESLGQAIGELKQCGLECIQSIEPASEDDWVKASQ